MKHWYQLRLTYELEGPENGDETLEKGLRGFTPDERGTTLNIDVEERFQGFDCEEKHRKVQYSRCNIHGNFKITMNMVREVSVREVQCQLGGDVLVHSEWKCTNG